MIENDLWGPIELNNWEQVPHIKNRVATEKDVQEGRATFFIDNTIEEHTPLEIKLPAIAFQVDAEEHTKSLVILIQAEKVGEEKIIGLRFFEGGNGVCTFAELEFT